ncbi:MAG: metallopeptidase TldD-related protein [Elusimicrobiota bacterium]
MKALLLAPLLLTTPVARAQSGADTLMRAMTDEMKRTVERLDMENLGRPYYVAYTARDVDRTEVEGTFGALKGPSSHKSRRLKIDLRVGTPAFDNTHYVGQRYWMFSPTTESLVTEDDYDALRYDIWSATDKAYKTAQETLSQKKAYKQNKLIREDIPDLSRDPAAASLRPLTTLSLDKALWEDRVRKLSAVFRRYPLIQDSKVSLLWTQQHTAFVDNEGRKVLKNDHDIEVYMEAETQAPDGMRLADRRRIIRQSPQDLPAFEALQAEAEKLAKDLSSLSQAPLWEANYTGPVLLEGQAAGEFFNQLLARNLSFPRSVWVEDEENKENFYSGAFGERFGLRVVSPLLSVSDDPSVNTFDGLPLIGHYEVDDEGIPAQKLTLVEKGILKDVPMSRSPIKARDRSNGHGRGSLEEFATAHIGSLFVNAAKTVPAAQLKSELLKQAKDYGLKYGLIIRRILDEERQEKGEVLAAPVLVYKVNVADGREELLRNAQFTGVTLRSLRDVAMAGSTRQVYNYYQLGPYKDNRGEVQASIVHPSVLISEMELKKSEKKPERPPTLKHPFFN